MSTQKNKFALFQRLQALGFTYDEAAQLRRIEMTLHRWAEAECNGDIQRDEKTGAPFRQFGRYIQANDPRSFHFIADREAGALRRLAAIVAARNDRNTAGRTEADSGPQTVFAYHQTDPRGCALYLVTRAQLGDADITSAYNRGLAVCC